MRIGIIGLGGIGGYFGARLAGRYAGEHEVVFIQRGRHLAAIRERGLRYVTRDHERVVRPDLATENPGEAGRLDLALLCVKSYSLKEALQGLGRALYKDSFLLTTLNGVDIAGRCRDALPGRTVLPGCIYLSAHIAEPGAVRQAGGAGKFHFGPLEGGIEEYRWIESLLAGAGIKAVLEPDVRARLWEKYLLVEPLATLTSASGLTIGQAARDPAAREQFAGLMREILLLAVARGVKLADGLIDENLDLAEKIPPETKTSMQLDIEAGRPAELDVFTEYVLRESGRSGLDSPLHRELYGIIKDKTGG